MKIAIIDDRAEDRHILKEMLCEVLQSLAVPHYSIDVFASGAELFTAWRPGRYSFVFFDIFIEQESGIEMARTVRKRDKEVHIVFVSLSNDFAAQSYEIEAASYFQKPLEKEKLASLMRRYNLERLEKKRFVELPDQEQVRLEDILYTNKHFHCVTFYLNGNKSKEIRATQKEVEALLACHPEFCSVGQGNIINMNHVKKITPEGFCMMDETIIHIPRRKYKELRDQFIRYASHRALTY